MTQTAAGSTLAISAAAPATQDGAGFAALTWSVIGGVEKLGTVGASFAKVEFQPLNGPKEKLKGSADYGTLQPSLAHNETDAGQVLLRTAANNANNTLYSFKVTYQDGAKRYFQGRVFGYPENTDGADTVLMGNPTIEVCTVVVPVPGP
jgi:hypothetical protein